MLTSRIAFAFMTTALAMASADVAMAAAGDEVVVSASPATRLPTEAELTKAKADAQAKADAAKPANTQAQVLAWLAGTPTVDHGDQTNTSLVQPDNDAGKRKIHGSMGASIGTGGYNSVYATALIPVGDTGTLGIAVSQTDYGNNQVYGGYGGYGYGRHGNGYGGYGNHARRGGTSTSVGLSFATDGSDALDTPDGCAPGFRDGGRYIEPLWVSRMQVDASCDGDRP